MNKLKPFFKFKSLILKISRLVKKKKFQVVFLNDIYLKMSLICLCLFIKKNLNICLIWDPQTKDFVKLTRVFNN